MRCRPAPLITALVTMLLSTPAFAQDAPAPDLSKYILTPKPPATPRINGPKVYGQRPGRPLLFTIPATGDRPMTFGAEGLPEGLKLDAKTGHITGSVAKAGEYVVTLKATNDKGAN